MVMVENVKKPGSCKVLEMGRSACTEDFRTYEFKDKKGEVFGSSHYEKKPDPAKLIKDSRQAWKAYQKFGEKAEEYTRGHFKNCRPSMIDLEDISMGKVPKGVYKIRGTTNGYVKVFADKTYKVAVGKNAHKLKETEGDDDQSKHKGPNSMRSGELLTFDKAKKILDEKSVYGNVRKLFEEPGQWKGIRFEYENNRVSAVKLTSRASSDTSVGTMDKTGDIIDWYIQRANTVEPDEE